jgi:HTH-type transcriptional regulator / antitoxin HigA
MTAANSILYTHKYHRLMREFPLRPLRNKKEAAAATAILDRLFRERYDDAGEEAYVLVLADLLQDYEDKNDPTPDTATGLDVLKHLLAEHGMTQADLGKLLGTGQSLVSMILSGDRPVTLEHAKRLGARFHVDPAVFLELEP